MRTRARSASVRKRLRFDRNGNFQSWNIASRNEARVARLPENGSQHDETSCQPTNRELAMVGGIISGKLSRPPVTPLHVRHPNPTAKVAR